MRWMLFLMGIVGVALQLAAPAPAADTMLQSLSLGARQYKLFVPGQGGKMPLVIALHGGGGTGTQFANSDGLLDKAAKEHFILALPEGSAGPLRRQTWNAGGCCGYAMNQKIDDVAFVRALIDELVKSGRVDEKRIYVVGLSNGAMLAQRVAIALGDRIAGTVVYVGALFGNESQPVAPVPMLILNAEKDDRVMVAGGLSSVVGRAQGMPYEPSRYAATFWAAANRCTKGPAKSDTADFVRESWTGCANGADVDFYITKGAGHGWPGFAPARPGVTRDTGRVNGTDLMWAFFAAHHR